MYIMGSDNIMTVCQRGGKLFGVYDSCYTPKGSRESEEVIEFIKRAPLGGQLDLLIETYQYR